MPFFKVTEFELIELDAEPEHVAVLTLTGDAAALLPADVIAELAATNTRDADSIAVHIKGHLCRCIPINSVLRMDSPPQSGYPRILSRQPLFETINAVSR